MPRRTMRGVDWTGQNSMPSRPYEYEYVFPRTREINILFSYHPPLHPTPSPRLLLFPTCSSGPEL